jgi:AraC-like DNA-binding protein
MTLFIKNMVSIRCKMLVKAELERLNLHPLIVELGEVTLKEEISDGEHESLKTALTKSGLVLMDDKRSILFEKIKNVIIEMIHYADELPETNFSDYLSKKLDYNYIYLSNLFSEIKGITIEHYIIAHKIERAKELLIYDELTLTEIAYKLHYSSVAHLSNQFKRVTGLTPSFFKNMKQKRLIAHEDV